MEKLSKDLRDQATKIINCEKKKEKKEIALKEEEKAFYKKQEVCHICEKTFVLS